MFISLSTAIRLYRNLGIKLSILKMLIYCFQANDNIKHLYIQTCMNVFRYKLHIIQLHYPNAICNITWNLSIVINNAWLSDFIWLLSPLLTSECIWNPERHWPSETHTGFGTGLPASHPPEADQISRPFTSHATWMWYVCLSSQVQGENTVLYLWVMGPLVTLCQTVVKTQRSLNLHCMQCTVWCSLGNFVRHVFAYTAL